MTDAWRPNKRPRLDETPLPCDLQDNDTLLDDGINHRHSSIGLPTQGGSNFSSTIRGENVTQIGNICMCVRIISLSPYPSYEAMIKHSDFQDFANRILHSLQYSA
jgi:hypothetical protein